MNLQEKVLTNFKKFHQGKTLRQQSHITGIQLTRLHRILNGAEMKLSEYEKLTISTQEDWCRINDKFKQLALRAFEKLSNTEIKDIIYDIESRLHLNRIKSFHNEFGLDEVQLAV